MKCPHLHLGHYRTCHSQERPYLPSPFELSEYCTVAAHSRCPFYMIGGSEAALGGLMGQHSNSAEGGLYSDGHSEA